MEPELYQTQEALSLGASPNAGALAGVIASMSMFLFVFFALIVLLIIAQWKLFTKAGEPGWKSLIPFYNLYIALKIAGMSGWWMLAFFIPVLNFIAAIIYSVNLAHVFGKSTAYGIFLLFFFSTIGTLMLAFGDAQYIGNVQPAKSKPITA